jgi:hypothetical protein
MPSTALGYGGKTRKLDSYQNPIIRSFTGTNPAANTELSETVPAGKSWLLVSVSVALVQRITQTPQPILKASDPAGNVVFESFGASAAQAVSTTCRYTWFAGGPSPAALVGATTDVHAVSCLPQDCYLPEGSTITTNTIGKGANSDYGAPQILVLEYS